jgi:hypothetical protein
LRTPRSRRSELPLRCRPSSGCASYSASEILVAERREVVFTLEVLTVRDATEEEMNAGGAIGAQPNIDPSLMRPI